MIHLFSAFGPAYVKEGEDAQTASSKDRPSCPRDGVNVAFIRAPGGGDGWESKPTQVALQSPPLLCRRHGSPNPMEATVFGKGQPIALSGCDSCPGMG